MFKRLDASDGRSVLRRLWARRLSKVRRRRGSVDEIELSDVCILQGLKERSSSARWQLMQRRKSPRSALIAASALHQDPRSVRSGDVWKLVWFLCWGAKGSESHSFLHNFLFFLGWQKSDTESVTSSEPLILTRSASQDSEASTVVGHDHHRYHLMLALVCFKLHMWLIYRILRYNLGILYPSYVLCYLGTRSVIYVDLNIWNNLRKHLLTQKNESCLNRKHAPDLRAAPRYHQ